jgi:hypothetical protein
LLLPRHLRTGRESCPLYLEQGGRMKSHVKGTGGGRPSPLRLSQAVDELGSPPRPSRRASARTVNRPSGPHSKDGPRQHWPSCSKRTENNVKAQPNQRTGFRTVLSCLVLVVEERSWARFPRLRDDITALALGNVHLLCASPEFPDFQPCRVCVPSVNGNNWPSACPSSTLSPVTDSWASESRSCNHPSITWLRR